MQIAASVAYIKSKHTKPAGNKSYKVLMYDNNDKRRAQQIMEN